MTLLYPPMNAAQGHSHRIRYNKHHAVVHSRAILVQYKREGCSPNRSLRTPGQNTSISPATVQDIVRGCHVLYLLIGELDWFFRVLVLVTPVTRFSGPR